MDGYSLPVAFVCQFLDDVPLERRGIDDVIVCRLAAEHGEAVMVPGGDADVFRTGRLDGRHPFGCVEAAGIEPSCEFGIFLIVKVFVGHCPFSSGKHGIDSPVEENAESVLPECFPGCEIFR